VDLTDLGSAEAMTRDEVSELLFSASIVGQRRSAARAMANLQKQRLELARSRQADARANRLLIELEEVRASLAEAAREAAAFPARQDELARLERAVTEERDEAERIDQRTRELDLLARLWDVLERKKEAEARLTGWKEPTALQVWLEEHATEFQSLRSACSGHLERVNQLASDRLDRAGTAGVFATAAGSSASRTKRAPCGLRSPSWSRAGGQRACWRKRPTRHRRSQAWSRTLLRLRTTTA
jgi:uncharacterized protein YhaN